MARPTHPLSYQRARFTAQRANAKMRGIAWEFTFEDWWALWQESGKWDQRGRKKGQYVMSRKGDAGPYSRDNVTISSAGDNIREGHRTAPRLFGARPTARGWVIVRGKYRVTAFSKYVGTFPTQAEAESARAAFIKHITQARASGVEGAGPLVSDSLVLHALKHVHASPATPLNLLVER